MRPELSKIISKYINKVGTEMAREEITRLVQSEVYKYEPQEIFKSTRRSYSGGGISDPSLHSVEYDIDSCIIRLHSEDAVWQHLWGGLYPKYDLIDVVERPTEEQQKSFHQPEPRPFREEAFDNILENIIDKVFEEIENSGEIEIVLEDEVDKYIL